jgi:hypothetical protein
MLATALSAGAMSQIFGTRELGDTYIGQETIASTQDPAVIGGMWWAASPVFISQYDTAGGFIEGGHIKTQDSSGNWQHNPYFSYSTNWGASSFTPYRYYTLTPGTYYKYTVYPSGNTNRFNVRFCAGGSFTNCTLIVSDTDMGRDVYNHAGAGGEGDCDDHLQCPIGFVGAHYNRFLPQWNPGSWIGYCWTNTHNNVAGFGGTISNCTNTDWDVNYR